MTNCRICGLPMIGGPSYGGPDVCGWCDCGVYRDGTKWSYKEATSPGRVRMVAVGKAYEQFTRDAKSE